MTRFLVPSSLILLYLTVCFAFAVGTAGLEEDEAVSFRQSAGLANHAPMECTEGYNVPFGKRCLPIMVASYVGAPKDYFLLPLFWVAGVHVGLARMGAALLAACGIFGAWFFISRFFGLAAGAVTAGFLALNPSYIDLPLFDRGNIAFSLGILGFILFSVALISQRASHLRFFLLGLLIGLGVWGRLNFSWLVLAAAIATLLVVRMDLLKLTRYLPALAAGILVGAAPLIHFLSLHSDHLTTFTQASAVTQTFQQSFHRVFGSLSDVMLASEEHRALIWHGRRIPPTLSFATTAFAIVAVAWCCVRRSKPALAVALTILVLFAEYLASGLPVASHHMVIFVPLAALAFGIAVSDLRLIPKAGPVAIALLCCAYTATAAAIDLNAAAALHRTGGYGEFSAGISNVVSFLKSHPDPNGLYTLDWGFTHPISVLSKGALSSAPLFRLETTGPESGVDWPRLLRDGGTFVTYSLEGLHFPEATIAFERELQLSGKTFTRTSFQERDGSPYADVYIVPRSDAGAVSSPSGSTPHTTFLASPAEVAGDRNGLGQTTLVFWTDRSKYVEIHVGAPNGPLLGVFRSSARTTSGVAKTRHWVKDGMTFYLQDAAGNPLTSQYTLATVKVSVK